MSAGTVRAAIRDWFIAADIAGVTDVFLDQPWFVNLEAPLDPLAGTGWGAVLWPHIDEHTEERVTLPVTTGSKAVLHRVALFVGYTYVVPTILPPGQREDAWVQPLDGLLTAVVARLRQDPTLGTGGLPIWQAAQGEPGQTPDITIHRGRPRGGRSTGHIYCWQVVEFTATEIITA